MSYLQDHIRPAIEQSRKTRSRTLWYFDALIDYMLVKPNATNQELGDQIRRSAQTVSAMINSDLFKTHFAKRRQEFTLHHDLGIIDKTTKIAHASLDAILTTLENKRDRVPLGQLQELAASSLERLGYTAPKPEAATAPVVNVQTNVQLPHTVTAEDIQQARMALRQHQAELAKTVSPSPPQIEHQPQGAGQQKDEG